MSQPSGCTVNYFCVGALLIFVGSISLCALGFTIVLPYEATRGWQETTCHVINSSYSDTSCSCQRQLTAYEPCILKYPCLQIYVGFRTLIHSNYENGRFLNATLTGKMNMEVKRSVVDISANDSLTLQTKDSPGMIITTRTSGSIAQNTERKFSTPSLEVTTETKGDLYIEETTMKPQISTLHSRAFNTATLRTDQTDEVVDHGVLFYTTSQERHESQANMNSRILEFQDDNFAIRDQTHDGTTPISEQTEKPGMYSTLNPRSQMMSAGEEKEAMIYRSWEDSFYKKCTLQECGDEEWNVKETSRFRLQWGRDDLMYTCYYDPTSPDKVIVERTKRSSMIHAVIWPVVTLLCGAGLWVGLFLGCCTMKTKGPEGETTKRTSRRRQYGLLQAHVTLPD